MVKIIAIIGEAGSGKDYLVKKLIFNYPDLFHEIVSCTTRPRRENEIDGIHYHFLTKDQFLTSMATGNMLETTYFRGWYYGTLLDSLNPEKVNLGVFNPEGIRSLLKKEKVQVIVYRLRVDAKERILRQLNREKDPNVDEIIRRYNTDKEDFSKLDFINIELPNNRFEDIQHNLKIISTSARADWDKKD